MEYAIYQMVSVPMSSSDFKVANFFNVK